MTAYCWEAIQSDAIPVTGRGSLWIASRQYVVVTVLGLGFCVRVRIRVIVTGSASYLNKKFVVLLAFVAVSVDYNILQGGDHCVHAVVFGASFSECKQSWHGTFAWTIVRSGCQFATADCIWMPFGVVSGSDGTIIGILI